jgi:hypothetical protein
VTNKDEKRPVISFQADKELVYKIDSLCAKENDSRNRVLGRIFEKALKDPEKDHSSPYRSLKESKKGISGLALREDGEKKGECWLWMVMILIATVVFSAEIIAGDKGTSRPTSGIDQWGMGS